MNIIHAQYIPLTTYCILQSELKLHYITIYITKCVKFHYLMREPRHEHGVARQLAHVTRAELPRLRRYTVLLHEGLLCACIYIN